MKISQKYIKKYQKWYKTGARWTGEKLKWLYYIKKLLHLSLIIYIIKENGVFNMNRKIFKKEICSYCKHGEYCLREKIEYIKENKIKILRCLFYTKKEGKTHD